MSEKNGAIMWSENCTVRYSNQAIFGILAFNPRRIPPINETHNIREPQQFKQVRKKLLDDLRDQAVSGGARRKAAAGNRTATANQTIYAMVQCTPDLSPENCARCLVEAAKNISDSCDNLPECRIYLTSCSLRYDDKSFYNITRIQEPLDPSSPPLSLRPSSPPPAGNDNDHGTRNIIIIVVSVVVFLAVASCVSIFVWKKKEIPNGDPKIGGEISTVESIQYDFGNIKAATNDFSDANKLGQGGFGAVYKGILQNGREIAVKRLSKDSGQGDLEFQNEVLLVARLQHRNLVRLFGFSIERMERLLIYEFVQNGSLDRLIFDLVRSSNLDWDKRYKIIMGVARGLVYLHEDSRLRIVHRDLKASNVLLDEEMNPKISDFGIAKLVVPEATHESTSRIVGTYGYMAPEYVIHGHFSIKSDVYSFGVVVLEIVSGQKIILHNGQNSGDLVSKAWKSWRKGTIANMIDPVLMAASGGAQQDMLRCIHIALLCVQENPDDRPTMASIVSMLNNFSLSLPLPSERQFCVSSISSDASLSQMEASTSSNSPSTQPLCSSGNDSVNHCH